MKNLLLRNMLLVSHREKKARKIVFDSHLTVIQGDNDTGKSSVIKSIVYAFGANPHKRHQKWKDADIAILVRFSLDNVQYAIYRHRDSFTLFDKNDQEIGTYSSVTLELAPVLADLFDFKLKLTDREGYSVTPPPAYLMLPFYIDQDKGWTDTWSSFTNLGQFAYWKQRVTGYHFGLRPDKWYELEANKKNLEMEKDAPSREMKAIETIKDRVYKDISSVDFDLDVEKFREEINELLDRCDELKKVEEKYRIKISELKTEKIRLDAQIEIVAKTHDELSEDYKFSCQVEDDSIGCPTCGAHYSNSFVERFEIAQDTETCTDLLASLRDDLKSIDREIGEAENSLSNTLQYRNDASNLLSRKKGDIKLKDLINLEGKKSLFVQLKEEFQLYESALHQIDKSIIEIEERMNNYDDPERRKSIVAEYGENLRRNTAKLGVFSLSDSVYKNINASIEESGSDLPRAILAYFFTALSAIEKNGNATFFPIIIDAPNQQEQDKENLTKMLKFIIASLPKDKQLILGLVEDAGVEFEGKVIAFDKKYSVLNEGDYKALAGEIRHYEAVNLSLGG